MGTLSREEKLKALHDISLEISAQLDLNRALQTIVREAARLLETRSSDISLYDPQKETLTFVASYGLEESHKGTVFRPGEGVVGTVFQTGQSLIVNDYKHWERRHTIFEDKFTIVMGVPLRLWEKFIGVLCVNDDAPGRSFTEEDLWFLELLASQVAIAIVNARLYEEEQRRTWHFETLAHISMKLASSLGLHDVLDTIAEGALKLVQANNVDIFLYDAEEGKEFSLRLRVRDTGERTTPPPPRRDGLTARVIASERPMVVHHAGEHPLYKGQEGLAILEQFPDLKVVASFPIRWAGKTLGVFNVSFTHPHTFAQEELDIMTSWANQVAIALKNAQLYVETKQRAEQMTALCKTSLDIVAQLDLPKLLYSIVERATALLNAKRGSIYIYDEEQDELELRFLYNFEQDFTGTRLKRGEGLSGKVLESGESMYVRDYRHWDGRSEKYKGCDFVSVLAVPLKCGERILGVLNFTEDKERVFSEEEVRFIELFANQAAIALCNAKLFAESKRLQQDLQDKLRQLQQTQAQLFQAEKLSALGQLISGIAHELNNPLTVVMGYAQLLEAEALSPSAMESVRRISTSAERARRIVQGLLAFAREQRAQRRFASLNDIVEQTLNLYTYQLRVNNIEVVTNLDRKLPYTVFDPYQMQQVFLNIIINAEQAMSEAHGRGRLIITSRKVEKDTIRLEFCDDGPGIPPEIMGKIFDPFFTTKQQGKGTGLGLSICFGIVTEHGGRIWAENNEGPGVTFFIELPICKEEKTSEEMAPPSGLAGPAPAHSAFILVIEDEKDVAQLLQRILKEQGHQVEIAEGGEKALEKLKEKDYDLLISDLKMPGMSGYQFYEYLKQFRPELARRVIFTTGDTIGSRTKSFLEMTDSFCLRKPFYVDEVWRMVKKALDNIERFGSAAGSTPR